MPALPAPTERIRSRGQLELELARLAMRVRRADAQVGATGHGIESGAAQQTIAGWFAELADDIVSRTDALLAPYAKERIKALGYRLRIAHAPAAAARGATPAAVFAARACRARIGAPLSLR